MRVWALVFLLVQGIHTAKAEDWLMVSCCSKHWRVGGHHYNEDNHGLALQHHFPNRDYVMLGNYRNSFYLQSNYAAYGFNLGNWHPEGANVELAWVVGGVTGYGDSVGEVNKHRAFTLPTLTIRNERMGVMFMGIPGILVAFGVQVRLP